MPAGPTFGAAIAENAKRHPMAKMVKETRNHCRQQITRFIKPPRKQVLDKRFTKHCSPDKKAHSCYFARPLLYMIFYLWRHLIPMKKNVKHYYQKNEKNEKP